MENYHNLLKESNYNPEMTGFLVDGFKNGFDLEYEGPEDVQQTAPNLKLTVGSELDLWNKVMKEVKLGRFAGPYDKIPFDNYIQSPIGLVPKDGNKDTRLIFHLSYPRQTKDGQKRSVNANIPAERCSVNYPDFSVAVKRCLEEGKGCHISRSDFQQLFAILDFLGNVGSFWL